MQDKQRILLLGGSSQQVPIIETAKRMGVYTVLVDYLPDNPGRLVADKWYSDSTTDVPKLLDIAKEEHVDGILAYASDPAAIPAAVVAEKLNLPGNPFRSIEILGYKHLFRKFLKENRFAYPPFIEFDTNSTDFEDLRVEDLNYPIVVKPTDSSGSKGVTIVKEKNELGEAIQNALKFSRNGVLILEEFIEREYEEIIGGDILIIAGKVEICGCMTAIRGNHGESILPIGEKFPVDVNPEIQDKIKEEIQRAISLLNIKNGEFNIEIIIGKGNKIYFLEIGPRAGGNCIPIQLSDVFGADLLEINVRLALGLDTNIEPEKKQGFFITYVLHSEESGELDEILIPEEIKRYVYREMIYKKKEDKVSKFKNAGDAVGILFLHFPESEDFLSIKEKLESMIKVKVK